uniref:Pentatricopeptide repeat-containing protein n=1 Tax=Ascaris lumbricoides TaxID=6252 RepID=A0A0M3HL12_ASCLU
MKQEDALRFVQSFGLTSYSCSKLFAILDTITSLEGDVLCEARKAARFIRAYKLRGAVGADKVHFSLHMKSY